MTANDSNIGVYTPGIIQFENANEGRSYPFEDNATLQDISGKLLPDNVITDLHLVVPKGKTAYLSSVYISESMISTCLKIYSEDTFYGALSVIVSRDNFQSYMPYRLGKLSGSEDIGGVITFGDVKTESIPLSYRFTDRSIKVEDSAMSRFEPARLRRLIDDRTGESISGDVKVEFSDHIEASDNIDGIRLSLKNGSAKKLASNCDRNRPVNECGATPIGSINDVAPDDENRIVLWFH